MKRFLLVLALVAVAGAAYVATAPGSQTAGPTARQFNILKRQVAALKKRVTVAREYQLGLGDFMLTCVVHAPIPTDSVGDDVTGYLFGVPGTPPASATSTSALTLDTSGTPDYAFFTENLGNQDCVDFINTVASRHALKRIGAFRNH